VKVYLSNQIHHFKKHLEILKSKNVMIYDKDKLTEKITEMEINTTKSLNDLNLDFFFDYNIFPSKILIFKTQWKDENREMKIGDTIVQQTFLPPIQFFSQKIVFGVRIKEIINENRRKGFSYETLEGHVEKGISTFTIEEINQKIKFRIHTFSSAGNLLSKLLSAIFTVRYQTYCTKQALKNVKQQVENQ